jgi:hypothetical protein
MQPVSSDVNETAGRRGCRERLSSRKPLVDDAGHRDREDKTAQADEKASYPPSHVDTSFVDPGSVPKGLA